VPPWPPANQDDDVQVMRLDLNPRAEPEQGRERYLFIDRMVG
jgi:hypothetical protein